MYREKFKILKSLYDLYDHHVNEIGTFVCEKGCAACCTCNVTMTSLETAYLFSHLDINLKESFMDQVRARLSPKRYHPIVTTNGFAALCASGEELPEEENDPLWGICPLLTDNICPVYETRPFGCRSFVSEKNCAEMDYALVSDFMLTVNSIFMQFIEHIDASGVSGNLTDMILGSRAVRNHAPGNLENYILRNRQADVLMVPSEHRQRVAPLLMDINAIIN